MNPKRDAFYNRVRAHRYAFWDWRTMTGGNGQIDDVSRILALETVNRWNQNLALGRTFWLTSTVGKATQCLD